MIMPAPVAMKSPAKRKCHAYYFEPSFEDPGLKSAPETDRVVCTESLPNGMSEGDQHSFAIGNTRLLTPDEERFHFRRYNFLKYRVAMLMQESATQGSASTSANLSVLHREIAEVRDLLIESNLRLVLSLARRVLPSDHADFEDLVSLGNEALMRATERFDYRLGYRFSSYAYQAIKCAIYGWLRTERNKRDRMSRTSLEKVELATQVETSSESGAEADEEFQLILGLLSRLDERDRQIVKARFGMDCPNAEPTPFRTISQRVGLSTTRVVQRYQRALAKLQRECQASYSESARHRTQGQLAADC